jgi:hypothetical protein
MDSQANQDNSKLMLLVEAILAKDNSQVFEYQALTSQEALAELALAIQIAEIIQTQNCDFATAQKMVISQSFL